MVAMKLLLCHALLAIKLEPFQQFSPWDDLFQRKRRCGKTHTKQLKIAPAQHHPSKSKSIQRTITI